MKQGERIGLAVGPTQGGEKRNEKEEREGAWASVLGRGSGPLGSTLLSSSSVDPALLLN